VIVVDLADTDGTFNEEGVFLVSGLEEVEMVVHGEQVEVVLQHDDVRVVEDSVRVLGPEGGKEPVQGDFCLGMLWGVDNGVAMTEVMRVERHKEDNTVSVEEATAVRIPPPVSEVSATGGELLVKAATRKAYLTGVLSEQPRSR
jgi:hypothetical protein